MMHCFDKESLISIGPSSRGSPFNVPNSNCPKRDFTLFKRTGSRNPKLIGSDNSFLNEANSMSGSNLKGKSPLPLSEQLDKAGLQEFSAVRKV